MPTEAEIRKQLTRKEIFERVEQNAGLVPGAVKDREWIHGDKQRQEDAVKQLVAERMAKAKPAPNAPNDLEKRFQKAMDDALLPGVAKGVIKDIQVMGDQRVEQLMASRGMTRAQARQAVMRENAGSLPRGGQIVDPVAFSRMRHELIQGGVGTDRNQQAIMQALGYLAILAAEAKKAKPAVAVK